MADSIMEQSRQAIDEMGINFYNPISGLTKWLNPASYGGRGTRGASIDSQSDLLIPGGKGDVRLGGQSEPYVDELYQDEEPLIPFGRGALNTPIIEAPVVEAVVDTVAPKRAGKTKTPKKQLKKRAAVRKAVKQPVVKQERFATVDPLNLFGNKNGANPFDSGNRGSDRFSGGIVDQRANDASYPQAKGSYGYNENDLINLF